MVNNDDVNRWISINMKKFSQNYQKSASSKIYSKISVKFTKKVVNFADIFQPKRLSAFLVK